METDIRSTAPARRPLPVLAEMPSAVVQHCAQIAVDYPLSAPAQTLRGIALRVAAKRPCVIAVTSLDPRDGQSSFAAGLARATSQLGLRTILLDGNLRLPSTAMHAGLAAPPANWVDVLRGTARLSQSMLKDSRSPMLFMAGAAGGADPRAVWASAATAKLMAHLRRVCDVVIVDAVAIAPGGELPLIAGLSDALVVVTAPHPGLQAALDHLKSTTTAPTGLVVAR